jgi:hypothetical protein
LRPPIVYLAAIADLGGMVLPGSPTDFAKLIAEEIEKVGQGDPRGQHQAGMTRTRWHAAP